MLFWSVTRAYHLVPTPGPATALSFRAISHWRFFVAAFYVFILAGAFIGVVLWKPEDVTRLAFLITFFMLSFLANAVILTEPRYHFSMMPLLVILAAYGYERVLKPQ